MAYLSKLNSVTRADIASLNEISDIDIDTLNEVTFTEPVPPTVSCVVASGAGFTINDLGGSIDIDDDQLNFQFDDINGFADPDAADEEMPIVIEDDDSNVVYSGSIWTRDGQTENEIVTINRTAVSGDVFTVICGGGV